MKAITIDEFYKDAASSIEGSVESLLPAGINKEIGHFNVFNLEELVAKVKADPVFMPYNRRAYYKISLVSGRNIAEYADKVINIEKNALLFATPKIPYNWVPQDMDQKGYFCIFTDEFLVQSKSGVVLDDLPIFRPGGYPVFQISDKEAKEVAVLFKKMQDEIGSSYLYKYDLIRNFVLELIHYGQKLQPLTTYNNTHNASARVSSLFIELLERQFPIASLQQKVSLRTAKDYADRLAIHSNHLNKVLKENTGKTTTEHISSRLIQEAKILLKQTDWNISEIAYSLGFEQLSHFSNFFKKQTSLSPVEIRNQMI
ncbi:MAG TPA: AraC family transcriptional regulator [Pedobacter sp.]